MAMRRIGSQDLGRMARFRAREKRFVGWEMDDIPFAVDARFGMKIFNYSAPGTLGSPLHTVLLIMPDRKRSRRACVNANPKKKPP